MSGRRAGSKEGLQKLLPKCWGWGREDVRREFLEDVALGSGMKSHPSCFLLKDCSKNGSYFSRRLESGHALLHECYTMC